MNLRRIRAVRRKEWRHLFRDPGSLLLMLLMPVMLLFLFGYAIRLDIVEAPLGVLQESHDPEANAVVARFAASNAFRVAGYYGDRGALRAAIQRGEVWAGLVVPADFPRDLVRGEPQLQLLLDGVDANTARLLRNYALALMRDYGIDHGNAMPLQVDGRVWFNEARESRIAILPGIIAVVMAVIGALMTSLTVAREMELGNLELLRTTALTRGEFLVGKLQPYFVIGLVDLLVAVGTTVFLFDVPLRGPFAGLAVVSALFLLVVMLQGALISIRAGQQVLASNMALVSTFLPAFLLSGFIFAIENMPVVLQYLTYLVPARYYVALSKAIFLKGVTPLLLWTEVAALSAILLVLATATFRASRKLGLLP